MEFIKSLFQSPKFTITQEEADYIVEQFGDQPTTTSTTNLKREISQAINEYRLKKGNTSQLPLEPPETTEQTTKTPKEHSTPATTTPTASNMVSTINLVEFITLTKQIATEKITVSNINGIETIRTGIREVFNLLEETPAVRKTALQLLLSSMVEEKIKQTVNLANIATIGSFCDAILEGIRSLKPPEVIVDELRGRNLKEFIEKADEVYRNLTNIHLTSDNQEIYAPILDKLMVKTFFNRVPCKKLKEHLVFYQEKSWQEFRTQIPRDTYILESLNPKHCNNCGMTGHFGKDCRRQKVARHEDNAGRASNVKCYNCNLTGHIAKDCRKPKTIKQEPRNIHSLNIQRANDHPDDSLNNDWN